MTDMVVAFSCMFPTDLLSNNLYHPLLELLSVTLDCGNFKFCMSFFYHPSNSSVEILDFFLHNYLPSINA